MTEKKSIRVIIIDDEASSHRHLSGLFESSYPQVELIASGHNVAEGYDLIMRHQPDLVFLDIEMPDGTGFDLLKKIGSPEFKIVFITGHNKYAVTAFQFGAIHYLLKPIDEVELEKAFQKVIREFQLRLSEEQLAILWDTLGSYNQRKPPKRIAISSAEGIHYKEFKDIVRLEAQKSYTSFCFANGGKLLASINMGEFIEQFEHYREFMKVHRSHIVNLYYVERYVKGDGGSLIMKDESEVRVSRLYKDELLERLSEL